MFYEAVKLNCQTRNVSISGHHNLPDVLSAKEILRRGLEVQRKSTSKTENDRRLIIDILNNLAYAEILSDTPDFSRAQTYLAELEAEFERSSSRHHIMLKSLGGRINDTRTMLAASQAFYSKDLATLEKCLEELKEMNLKDYLSEPQLKVAREHILRIEAWINSLKSKAGDHD